MVDRQGKNTNWTVIDEHGKCPSWERAGIAVLMDIRRELRKIERNTRKRKRRN